MESPQAESEFLKRELGINWTKINQLDLKKIVDENLLRGKKTLLIISNPEAAKKALNLLPPRSVVIILLSDEKYSYSAFEAAQNVSVSAIFRNYSISKSPVSAYLRTVLSSFNFQANFCSEIFISCIEILRAVKMSLRIKRRISMWRKLPKKVFVFPLGYTDKFVQGLTQIFDIRNTQSLFKSEFAQFSNRPISISFRGTSGSWQRRNAIMYLSKIKLTSIEVTGNQWNGHLNTNPDIEYCNQLISSKYTAALPGYTCNESFRYYESLICGSVPLRSQIALAQGAVDTTISNDWNSVFCFKEFREINTNISETMRNRLLHKQVRDVKMILKRTRIQIELAISSR